MKKFAVYTVAGLALAATLALTAFKPGSATTATNTNPYILVEIYEIPSYGDKGVHIHYGNAKTEVIPFKAFSKENHDDNGDIILNAVNKLVAEGYHIESSTSGLTDAGMITKLFMRKK